MTQPLALVIYEDLLPGTQLVNRLQDLKYRVRAINDVESLESFARKEKPMVVFADIVSSRSNVCGAIARLKASADTRHIPVIAFADDDAEPLQSAARAAGASLVVSDSAILSHLSQFLEQALQVD
jgi:CheY-like chemotaxis protein